MKWQPGSTGRRIAIGLAALVGFGAGLVTPPRARAGGEECKPRSRCSDATWDKCRPSPNEVCMKGGVMGTCWTQMECPQQ